MKASVERLLLEAYRRNGIGNKAGQGITERWLGLGTEAEYRPAIAEGLMVWHDGIPPPKRILGWLCLTNKGAGALLDLVQSRLEKA